MKIKRVLSAILVITMLASMMSFCLVSNASDFMQNTSPKPIKLSSSDMDFYSQQLQLTPGLKGVTLWYRVEGAKEPFMLYEAKFNVYTREFPNGLWSYNHGQDGVRQAAWRITANGDYLFYIPFNYYTLSHQFLGSKNDIVTAISRISMQVENVSAANRNATIALMGVLEGKVDSFNTDFVTDGKTEKVSGKYNYMEPEVSSLATPNLIDAGGEHYNPSTGDVEKADTPYDHTATMKAAWVYAYVDSALPAPADKAGQVFAGWTDAAKNGSPMIAKGENTLYANYKASSAAIHTVTFQDDQGNTLYTAKVADGASAVYHGAQPSKPDTDTERYSFTGWDKALMAVTEDITTKAVFETRKITYDVTYMNGTTALAVVTVDKYAAATYDEVLYGAPVKNGNKDEYYEFDKWVGEDGSDADLSSVSAHTTVYAKFKAVPETKTYTVTLKDSDGTTLETLTTGEHSYIDYRSVPTKACDGDKFYTFTKWVADGSEDAVDIKTLRADTTLTAVYAEEAVEKDSKAGLDLNVSTTLDGKEIALVSNPYVLKNAGQDYVTLLFKAEGVQTPATLGGFYMDSRVLNKTGTLGTKLSSNSSQNYQNDKSAFEIEEDGYYYLSIGRYMVNWVEGNGYGSVALLSFSRSNSVGKPSSNTNDNLNLEFTKLIEGPARFTVRFFDEDKTTLLAVEKRQMKTGSMTSFSFGLLDSISDYYTGDAPTKEAEELYSYVFDKWVDAEGNPVGVVSDNMSVYASYKKVIKDPVTVTFMNGDAEADAYDIPKGTATKYEGAAPVKASDKDYSYIFQGWTTDASKVLVIEGDADVINLEEMNITANTTFYAVYVRTERMAEVTYVNEAGETVAVVKIQKGEIADGAIPAGPEKAEDAQFTYEFKEWVDEQGKAYDLTDAATLAAIEGDVTLKPNYTATTKNFTVTFMNGEEVHATVEVAYGTQATAEAPVKESANYTKFTFDKWVTESGNDVDLSSVTADMTVYASYAEELEHSFTDLVEGAWYMSAVKYALQNGLMSGMNNTTFAPDATMTRAQFATVLYRMEGEPDVSEMEDPSMPDYNANAWWADAFKWANNVGIINGSNINGVAMLDPDGTVTRLQIATMLYRYADKVFKADDGSVGIDMSELPKLPPTSLADFQDKNLINYSGTEARWAYNHEYITGMTKVEGQKPYFAPSDGATRAQVITILMRFLEDTEHHGPKKTAE